MAEGYKSKMGGKKEKENAEISQVTEADNVRKSSRIKQNSKFEERMSMFIMQSKKKDSSDSEDDPEEKRDEREEPEEPPKKIAKKQPDRMPRAGKKIGRPKKNFKIKEEKKSSEEDEDDAEGEMTSKQTDDFNLGLLELRPVGEEASPTKNATLNSRGMPPRIRKKNKLFFDDDVVNPLMSKKEKMKKVTEKRIGKKIKSEKEDVKPTILEETKEGNNMRQRVGMKLRNLLKLPKAQRWVFNEFFYSNIDNALFLGSNDFLECLKETFGHLRTTSMTRTEWCAVRRLMGKPRRCSQSFLVEERQTLERRRNVIRLIQQRKIRDASQCKGLPDRLPLQLSVNARVTAKLRYPQSGLFTGKVDAVDPSNHTYRITFDRPGLGTHSIPDYEVLLHGEPDMVSISAMQKRYITSKFSTPAPKGSRVEPSSSRTVEDLDPQQVWKNNSRPTVFPKQFYDMIIRICKILKEKKQKVSKLKDLNGEAEKMLAGGEEYPVWFQQQYAALLVELESLNISLNRYLTATQKYCHQITPEICASVMLAPSYLREKSIADAKATMDEHFKGKAKLANPKTAELVIQLMALVLQLQNLTRPKANTQDRQVLKQTISKIKSIISPQNLLHFQNSVEVHVKYIEAAFSKDNHLSPLLVPTQSAAGARKAAAAAVAAAALAASTSTTT